MEPLLRDRGEEDNQVLLGALLRFAYQAMMTDVVEPGLVAAGYEDVRASHFPLLQLLYPHPGGVWSTELAIRARITKQSMGYLVDYLEAHGYVERALDPSDGRARLVRLTTRGWELGAVIRRLVRQAEARWAEHIGGERVEELRCLLRDIVTASEADAANHR